MNIKIKAVTLLVALLINVSPIRLLAEETQTVVDTGDLDTLVDAVNTVNDNQNQVLDPGSGDTTENAGPLVLDNLNLAETSNDLQASSTSGVNQINNSPEGDSFIFTGDINSASSLENSANNNVTGLVCDTCAASSSQSQLDAEKESLDSTDIQASTTQAVLVQNDNQATTTNLEVLEATSGANEISGSNDALINTGDIGIVNILINFINTNFFGNGKQFFVNIFNKVLGNIDLSSHGVNPSGEETCLSEDCTVTLNNDNKSTLDNSIVIDAVSGQNLIANTSGQAEIKTGDIDIVNDVLNIANINVSGDEWFFAVVNIFGELDGDVVLPTAYKEASTIVNQPNEVVAASEESAVASTTNRELIIGNQNAGELINDIVLNANTGENTIASSAESFIQTGDVEIKSMAFNLINYNISGDTWKFARVNVFGSWEGIIQGLPAEYSYLQDENGITIYNTFLDDYKIDAAYAQLLVNNDNQATTTNEIEINADTGNNLIADNAVLASISTGGINIQNSLINFINSNFTGKNWEFSMVNVFGDWKGNLSFGQPELWIVETADKSAVTGPGDQITYTFLFGNSGDALASNVFVSDTINQALVRAVSSDTSLAQIAPQRWELGDLPPNTQGSLSYTVVVKDDLPLGASQINNEVLISGDENERDYLNNISGATVLANYNPSSGGSTGGNTSPSTSTGLGSGSGSGSSTLHPSFSVIKTNNAQAELKPGDTVDYKITIKNTGTADAQEVLVLDVLKKQDEEIEVHQEFWDLKTLYVGEEVLIEYSLVINEAISSGVYNNEVLVEGLDASTGKYIEAVGSSKIKVNNENYQADSEVLVLGVEGKPDLRVTKNWPDNILYPGDIANYTVVVRNDGNLTAYDIKLVETLPKEMEFVDIATSKKTTYLGKLLPGYETSLSFQAYVLGDALAGDYESNTQVFAANNDNLSLVNSVVIDRFLADEQVVAETPESAVLAATGFSLIEFVSLIFAGLLMLVLSVFLRRRISKSHNETIGT